MMKVKMILRIVLMRRNQMKRIIVILELLGINFDDDNDNDEDDSDEDTPDKAGVMKKVVEAGKARTANGMRQELMRVPNDPYNDDFIYHLSQIDRCSSYSNKMMNWMS